MFHPYQFLASAAVLLLAAAGARADTGDYRSLGYMYLSPLPGAEYTPTQTKFVLVRFKDIAPSVVTNLAQFVQVSGASSGTHAGQTKIASDHRTVIFEMSTGFQDNELVTVTLTPQTPAATVQPYQYKFMITGHMPDYPAITARGDNPPNQTKDKAFDGNASTQWLDLVVPNGSANFSWIQYVYPDIETHMVNQYAITSASDAPERDPKDWRFYGVDAANNLTLLDTRTNQTFASRGLTTTYAFTNTTDFRGYRLEITKVANAATASGVQVAELALIEPTGSILREYWTGISGTAVSALTSNASYPNSPTGRSLLARFEAPTDWADSYGTRVRGYVTAPVTGSYVFWIASDDNSELWLSTNADPANKAKIADVPGWTSSQQWDSYAEQKSAAIPLVAGQKYYIEALQKEDGGGDNLAVGWAKPGQATTSPSQVIPGWVLSPWILTGSILREYWTGIPGTAVSALTSNASYPNNPSGSTLLTSFEAPTNWADSYGTRVRGYITAPSTGSYVFWIASDDNGELWLSTGSDPAAKTKIASVPGWTDSREWDAYSEQKSVPISLTAGQTYYVEALQKEDGGGDNLAVGWAKPGQATTAPSEVIPGSVLSPWIDASAAAAAPIAAPAQPLGNTPASPGKTGLMPNGVSVPSDFPHIAITTNDNPCTEPIFIDNRGGNGNPYNVIFDNTGSPIWYQRMPDERRDMKVQPNGVLTLLARDKGQYFYGMNTHYEKIAEYWTVNGYSVDEHELQMLADGTYFLIGLNSETVDLSRYVSGGSTSASVTEDCIQQFTPAGELIFQWRAWDHLDPAGQNTVVSATNPGDFTHMNAIAVDSDGNILLSSRNTSEVTKINADTGEIIWRLGGTHNQFTYVNDPLNGQRNQHALRPLGNNHYTLFDNGNGHSPPESRAVEYQVDPVAMTATLVWQYPATPTTSMFSFYMGDVQRLPNGNTLINWAVGNLPKLTEVRPDGSKAFEMNWVDQFEAYRVWRCPWQGVALKPYLILEAYPDNVTLLFNQFGDSTVVTYRIYGGTSPQPTTLLATSGTTMKSLSNLTSGQTYYFRVTAVNNNGVEGAYSNEESVAVNIIKPGQNMLANGDFSGGTTSWTSATTSPAAMTWTITGGYSSCVITNGGSATSSLQLKQTGLPLILGNTYVLEFDAWSSGSRYIEAKLQNSAASLTYSGTKTPALTPTKQHFRYIFTMQQTSDFGSMLAFNLGASTKPVYLDNVLLFNPPPGDLNMDGKVDLLDLKLMGTDWRKQQSGLTSDVDGNGKVDFADFGILGDNWSASP